MKSAENLASPVVLCTCTETTAKFFFVVGKGNFGGKKVLFIFGRSALICLINWLHKFWLNALLSIFRCNETLVSIFPAIDFQVRVSET
jgi:hypothetical protein